MTSKPAPSWNVYIELDIPASSVAEDKLINLNKALDAFSPAVSCSPNGNLTVHIFVDADTTTEAMSLASQAVVHNCREANIPEAPIVGVEVMTEAEFDRRFNE